MPFRIEPVFSGFPVVIIAGGESVTARDFHSIAIARLENRIRVIAVSDAVYPAWWADWLHSCDMKWWTAHIQRVQHFPGIKTTLDPLVPRQWAGLLQNTGKEGFDPDPENCRTGANSSYQAMHCSIHAYGSEICLVGVDVNNGGYWFGGHQFSRIDVDRTEVMLPHFSGLVPELEARKIKVVNASKPSLLDIWPKVDLQTYLDAVCGR